MKKKILKIVYWLIGIIIVVLASLWFLGTYYYSIQNYFITKSQQRYVAQVEKNKALILEMQKNDNFGGKTPEETLDLYITALKAGDIELASKYWEVSVEKGDLRIRELEALKKAVERDGNLDLFIKEVENIRNLGIKKFLENGNVSFIFYFKTEKDTEFKEIVSGEEITTIIPSGTELKAGNALRLNLYTKVWKIIQ